HSLILIKKGAYISRDTGQYYSVKALTSNKLSHRLTNIPDKTQTYNGVAHGKHRRWDNLLLVSALTE
ncbi:MAG: hypothetical protein AAFV71_20720, partial [Cyanobacteria bacterium J06633_8]